MIIKVMCTYVKTCEIFSYCSLICIEMSEARIGNVPDAIADVNGESDEGPPIGQTHKTNMVYFS